MAEKSTGQGEQVSNYPPLPNPGANGEDNGWQEVPEAPIVETPAQRLVREQRTTVIDTDNRRVPPTPRRIRTASEPTSTRITRDQARIADKKTEEAAKKASESKQPEKIPDNLIDLRSREWATWLQQDANPLLVKFSQNVIGAPDPWMNSVVARIPVDGKEIVFWEPHLQDQLALTESECKSLAKAAAVFSTSPMGLAIAAWVKTNQQLIALAIAMYAAGKYGWRLMQLKAQVSMLKEQAEKAQAAMAARAVAEEMANQNGGGGIADAA